MTTRPGAATINPNMSEAELASLYDSYATALRDANVAELKRARKDLIMWRRGSARWCSRSTRP
jgi:hypothetical protein